MGLIFYLIFLNSIAKIISTFTPESFYTFYKNNSQNLAQNISINDKYSLPNYILIDSNNSIQDKTTLLEIQNRIYKTLSVHVIIEIIDEIEESDTMNLPKFSERFIQIFYNDIIDLIDNSISIVLDISKKDFLMVPGQITKEKFTDEVINEILNGVNEKIEDNKYDDALFLMLDNILNVENIRKRIYKDNVVIYIISIVVAFFILIILIILSTMYYRGKCFNWCYKKEQVIISERVYVKNLEKFLNIIDNDNNSGLMQQKEICKNYCIICLEHFIDDIIPDQIKIHNYSMNTGKNKNIPIIKNSLSFDNDNFSREKLDIKSQDELIHVKTHYDKIDNNSEINFKIKIVLKCGHSFHKKCIDEWMKIQKKCPICKEKLDKVKNGIIFRKKIVNIQKIREPLIGNWLFYYNGKRIMHKLSAIFINKTCCINCILWNKCCCGKCNCCENCSKFCACFCSCFCCFGKVSGV